MRCRDLPPKPTEVALCEFCDEEFQGKRADARFCSGSCRALASQARKANEPSPSTRQPASSDALRHEVHALIERMAVLERSIADLAEDVVDVQERQSVRVDLDTAARTAVAPLADRVQALEASTRAHAAPVLAARDTGRLAALERAFAQLSRTQASLRDDLAALATAVARALDG